MAYQPTQDNIIISVAPAPLEEKTTDSGIILPDAGNPSSASILRGTVLGVGPGFRSEGGEVVAPSVALGDEVLVEATAPSLLDIEPSRPGNEPRLYVVRDYDVRVVFSRR